MPDAKKLRLVVLLSGNGSNLQAFIDAVQNNRLRAEIAAVISNEPNAFGLKRAESAGIPTISLNHKDFSSRESFDKALKDQIDRYTPNLVILAGFMRILTEDFVNHYKGRMLNIHPSLLPKYRGLHTHERAIEAGDKTHGTSVHFVTSELDGGPIVAQWEIPIEAKDTPNSLTQKIQLKEHLLYPEVVRWIAEKRLTTTAGALFFDDTPIPETGLLFKGQYLPPEPSS